MIKERSVASGVALGQRISPARCPEQAKAAKRKGLYSLPRRTHILFGVLYLLLGAFLIATALGFKLSPFK